jgi:hypothetical protein
METEGEVVGFVVDDFSEKGAGFAEGVVLGAGG